VEGFKVFTAVDLVPVLGAVLVLAVLCAGVKCKCLVQ
jgi:hypothetical protein